MREKPGGADGPERSAPLGLFRSCAPAESAVMFAIIASQDRPSRAATRQPATFQLANWATYTHWSRQHAQTQSITQQGQPWPCQGICQQQEGREADKLVTGDADEPSAIVRIGQVSLQEDQDRKQKKYAGIRQAQQAHDAHYDQGQIERRVPTGRLEQAAEMLLGLPRVHEPR